MAESSPKKPVQWILDTRSWYPEATETRHLETHASRALALLTPTERAAVLRYFHLRDAKLSLASSLLKRYAIAKLAPSEPKWSSTVITRDPKTTKPIWIDPSTGKSPVSFNVSHQAGIVALVAVAVAVVPPAAAAAELGVDVVCTSERRQRDHSHIAKEGWPSFVDMHADVFGPGEVRYLKYQVLSSVPWLTTLASSLSTRKEDAVVDGKLRAFYALWALREAYVKLTGEALLAPWLKDLEFREFCPPKPSSSTTTTRGWDVPPAATTAAAAAAAVAADDDDDDGHDEEEDEKEKSGEVVRTFDIRFKGKKVEDVNMCLRSIGPDYMIATAVRTPEDKDVGLGWRLGPYEILTLDEVLEFAESRNNA